MNLVISAMQAELSATIVALQPTEIIKYDDIKLYQKVTWLFAISKIGLVNATMSLTTLINDYAIKTIYNIGTVGSLKKTVTAINYFAYFRSILHFCWCTSIWICNWTNSWRSK